MTTHIFAFVLLLLSAPVPVARGQSSQAIAPQTVEIPSGNLLLKAFVWTPAGSGPFLPSYSVMAPVVPTLHVLAHSRLT